MEQIARDIAEILKDYQHEHNFQFNENHVLNWVKQFDEEDQEFVLSEFLHLLKQDIYISKQKGYALLKEEIGFISAHLKYPDVKTFLSETVFLDMQKAEKSQKVLLNMLDEILKRDYDTTVSQCGQARQKNFVYLDDVLATGKTVLRDCKAFLNSNNIDSRGNIKAVVEGKVKLIVGVFCSHSWAISNIRTNLKLSLNEDRIVNAILFVRAFEIENNLKEFKPKLNLAYPISDQSSEVKAYLQGLHQEATKFEDRAYRHSGQPEKEAFFSSSENRIRFENIILKKGIEILKKVKESNPNHRPLGDTYPHYKTFGTGTLFFTWRNISNTCPLVFWWHNKAHGWQGLFPLQNRGN